MKLGFIVDSSIGLTKKEAEKKGFIFIPLYLNINNKEYSDGIGITAKEYFSNINIEDDVKTSASSPKEILKAYKKASKQFDHVFVYAISEGISSQVNNLKTFAKEFKNIHVINSKVISSAIEFEINDIVKKAQEGKTIKEIFKYANDESKKWTGLIIPKKLDWLVKGGRVSSSIAAMSNLLKIVPILRWENGKMSKEGKGRVFKKTVVKEIKKMKSEQKTGKIIVLTGTLSSSDFNVDSYKDLLGDKKLVKIPPVIANHLGPETIAFLVKR